VALDRLTEVRILIEETVDTHLCRLATLRLLLLWTGIVVIHQHQSESLVPRAAESAGRCRAGFPRLIGVHVQTLTPACSFANDAG
jgi:hypothetical protein